MTPWDSAQPISHIESTIPSPSSVVRSRHSRNWAPTRRCGSCQKASFKSIAELFREHPGSVPSEHVDPSDAAAAADEALTYLGQVGIESLGVRVHGAGEYPLRLRDAKEPVELLYYRGWWDFVDSHRSIAVVGTREISDEGLRRTRKLVRELVQHDFTIVSGLARGVDTA